MTVNYELLADAYSKHRNCDEAIIHDLLSQCSLVPESRVLEVGAAFSLGPLMACWRSSLLWFQKP